MIGNGTEVIKYVVNIACGQYYLFVNRGDEFVGVFNIAAEQRDR